MRDGGAVNAEGFLTLEDSTFRGNTAEEGGAVRVGSGTYAPASFAIRGSTFSHNAAARGGAIQLIHRAGLIADSVFTSNATNTNSDRFGGAILAELDAVVTLTGSRFEDNTAGTRGGALFVRDGATVDASGLLVCGNTSGVEGAVGSSLDAVLTLQDSLLYANVGGGLYFNGGSSTITGNTFAANGVAANALTDTGTSFSSNLVTDHTGIAVQGFVRQGNLYFGNAVDSAGGSETGAIFGDPVFPFAPACSFEAFRPSCNGPAADGTSSIVGASACIADVDQDGSFEDEDCDDLDPGAFPGAIDSCNGVDDDCNGHVDDDASMWSTWFDDLDGDGFGAGVATTGCPPAQAATDDRDCDDANASVNPLADEGCNEVDDDCDGEVDEGLPVFPSYADGDHDGFGDPLVSIEFCDVPQGYVTNAEDCDDDDPTALPGAVEACADGVDNDCDGLVDTLDPDALSPFFADLDGDGVGAGPPVFACTAPADHVPTTGDCDDTDPTVSNPADCDPDPPTVPDTGVPDDTSVPDDTDDTDAPPDAEPVDFRLACASSGTPHLGLVWWIARR